MNAHQLDLVTPSVQSDRSLFDRFKKPALVLGAVIALAGLGGCARGGALDALPPAPAAGFAPQDGPPPTATSPRPTTTTSPLRTTTWTVAPPRYSTEPRPHPDPHDYDEMTFDEIRALIDPHGESDDMVALAWGDVDGDGDIDAIVLTTWCGASCGKQLDLVLNNNGTPTAYSAAWENAFEPWFIPAGAGQSFELSATIGPADEYYGTPITLTGRNLCGEDPMSMAPGGPCDDHLLRTATYIFHDASLNPSSIEPPLGMTPSSIQYVIDPNGESSSFEVLAWGDIDGDGDIDAVVRSGWCDASCGTRLDIVFATDAGAAVYVSDGGGDTFAPYYNGGGAAQSSVTSVIIDDSADTFDLFGGAIIELHGERLCDPNGQTQWTDCGQAVRNFLFDDNGNLWAMDND